MKKVLLTLICVAFIISRLVLTVTYIIFLISAVSAKDRSKAPYNFDKTRWISHDPEICFTVDHSQNGEDLPYGYAMGEVMFEGESKPCVFQFIPEIAQVYVFIIKDADHPLPDPEIAGFCGYCTYYDDRLVIKIDKETKNKGRLDTLYNGKVDTIIMYREDIYE